MAAEHRTYVYQVPEGHGAHDYFVVCSCGWVSASHVFRPEGADRECIAGRVAERSARNRREFEGKMAAAGVIS